ncbi:MAG: PilZ domain-containing protein [Huintestinicola sp.]|uniref:PilZ domain-containing protein n=1 Tax=Huintestinicola sp. TaxID=2981661 RepID=UPI003F003F33
MINKDKIQRVDIYDQNGKRVLSTKSFSFPRDFFKIKGYELVAIKGNDLPLLSKGDQITVIFEYLNGTRIQCNTRIDLSTDLQLNFHVDDGMVLEERRGSYKVNTPGAFAKILHIERGEEEITDLEEPYTAAILNINLTGVLMKCDMELNVSDIVRLKLLDDPIEINTEILRLQLDNEGELIGYGCRFLDVTPPQEEKIARFIFNCQLAERERRKNEGR